MIRNFVKIAFRNLLRSKILGAPVFHLWQMLSKDFLILVIISCLAAIPVSYYFSKPVTAAVTSRTEIPRGIFWSKYACFVNRALPGNNHFFKKPRASSIIGILGLVLVTISLPFAHDEKISHFTFSRSVVTRRAFALRITPSRITRLTRVEVNFLDRPILTNYIL